MENAGTNILKVIQNKYIIKLSDMVISLVKSGVVCELSQLFHMNLVISMLGMEL